MDITHINKNGGDGGGRVAHAQVLDSVYAFPGAQGTATRNFCLRQKFTRPFVYCNP